MSVLGSMSQFLQKSSTPDDLKRRCSTPGLEFQFNTVVPRGFEPIVDGKSKSTWGLGTERVKNIRCPYKSDTDNPEFRDYPAPFDPRKYGGVLGFNGWNFLERTSLFVGFDVDSLVKHTKGLTPDEIKRVVEASSKLSYVETRNSKGGTGLHLYVDLEPIPSKNHKQHALHAKLVLQRMCKDAGFNFLDAIDVYGHILWVASTTACPVNGFKLIQGASEKLKLDSVSVSFAGTSVEVVVPTSTPASNDVFAELTQASVKLPLDAEHKELVGFLTSSGCCQYVAEKHCYRVHTWSVADAHETLGLRGTFKTISPGTDLKTPNAFMFPLHGGAWRVVRFGDTPEHESWAQGSGCKHTILNAALPMAQAAKVSEGVQVGDKLQYENLASARAGVAAMLGKDTDTAISEAEQVLASREVMLSKAKGNVVLTCRRSKTDPESVKGWERKGTNWCQYFRMSQTNGQGNNLTDYDDYLRFCGDKEGWFYCPAGKWKPVSSSMATLAVRSRYNLDKEGAAVVMGLLVDTPWELVQIPFGDEYPGGRQWNRTGAQLRHEPIFNSSDKHPTWDALLANYAKDLNIELPKDAWCKRYGITTGGKWMQAWLAFVFQHPTKPLPMITAVNFAKNSGKSTLFMSVQKHLLTSGVRSVEQALTGKFDGEVEGTIVGYIDEKNLNLVGVSDKVKQYITSPLLEIRPMYEPAKIVTNYLHLIHCINDLTYCPVEDGDDRIVILFVQPPASGVLPPEVLEEQLNAEAPYFIGTLMSMQLPPPHSRLGIPAISTPLKVKLMNTRKSSIQKFINSCCEIDPASKVLFKDLYEDFARYSDNPSTKNKFREDLDIWAQCSTGVEIKIGTANKLYVHGLKIKSTIAPVVSMPSVSNVSGVQHT